MKRAALLLSLTLVGVSAFAQDIQVNRQNKTIAVTAEESVTADAEVAVLAIGYHNYGLTQDLAFHENVRAAEKIASAILAAKIPEGNIETEKLSLGRAQIDDKWNESMKRERQFQAEQSWHVRLPAPQAQGIVDISVNAGANEVEDVEWDVADPVALQAKASGAALAKARTIAEQMAKGLGTKLGELVYASNRAPVAKMWRGMTAQTSTAMAGSTDREPKLKLFPEKVKSNATVYAVFSIE
jgi:hypothetical protein